MRRELACVVLALLVSLLVAGCSANRIAHPVVTPPTDIAVDPLNRTQYEVLERTVGSGQTQMVALWPIPIWWIWSDDGTFWLFGYGMGKTADRIARARAIDAVPGADDLMEPIKRESVYDVLWYRRVKVTVAGKAIAVKTDLACKSSENNCWESLKWGDND